MTIPRRQSLIKLIHTGRRALGMDEDAYRDMLERFSGKRSCTEITDSQLSSIVQHIRDLGFDPAADPETAAQRALIHQIWLHMHHAGIVRDRSLRALDAYCIRTAHSPLWRCSVKGCQTVIESLKAWHARMATPDQISRLDAMLSRRSAR